MNEKGRIRAIKFVGFLIVFFILLLILKLFSISPDKINLALKPIKIFDNCLITIYSTGTTVKENGEIGYSFSKIVSKTSKGVTIGDDYQKIFRVYHIKNKHAIVKELINEETDEYQETLYNKSIEIDENKTNIIVIKYKKENNKWILKDLSNDNNDEESISYSFIIKNKKVETIEIFHKK